MFENINKLINTNLNLICESKESEFLISHFLDDKNSRISLIHYARLFATTMEEEGLISVHGDFAYVEDFGREIYNKGGWENYIANKESISIQKALYDKQKEELEFEKTKTDLELAKRMLNEYPKTKWFARIAFIIATLLGLKELWLWIISLSSKF